MNKAAETAQKLQTLLDDCATYAATQTACTCEQFDGACLHTRVLTAHTGLYTETTADITIPGPRHQAIIITRVRYTADIEAITARLGAKAAQPVAKPVAPAPHYVHVNRDLDFITGRENAADPGAFAASLEASRDLPHVFPRYTGYAGNYTQTWHWVNPAIDSVEHGPFAGQALAEDDMERAKGWCSYLELAA